MIAINLRSIFILAVLISLIQACAENVDIDEVPENKFQLKQIEEMFKNIRETTDWDISVDMLWGYYFIHSETSKLEKAKVALISKGYSFVSIHQSDRDGSVDIEEYWLRIEKIETHTPQSLNERNNELYKFAAEFGIDEYDGMDVGPPD